MPSIHDSGYKKLFSNKRIFRQLIETFVTEKWVQDLDFDTCEMIDKSFVADHYKETESDIIYKIKLVQKDFFIIILLEFQSGVERFMSLRILNYITNFYMDYLQSNKGVKKLPPIFPILLYNGNRKWTAPESIVELIDGEDFLGKYGLQFRYFKIDENAFSLEKLLKIKNLVSTLFLAEAHYDIEMLKNEFLNLYDIEEDKTAISLLLNWFLQLREHGRIASQDYEKLERVYQSKEEVKQMLITAIEKEKQAIFDEGRKEGRKEGKREGKREGKWESKIEVAKVLFSLGQDIDLIEKATSLPRATLEKIRKNLNA